MEGVSFTLSQQTNGAIGLLDALFETADGVDRFGLIDRRPAALTPLPHFPSDELDAGRSDGDLRIQAC